MGLAHSSGRSAIAEPPGALASPTFASPPSPILRRVARVRSGLQRSCYEESLFQRRRRAGGRAERRHDDHVRRLRPVRHSGNPDRGGEAHRRQGPDRHLQQCRRRRHRPRRAAGDRADQQDDLVLCRREQDLRQPLSLRQARARVQSAGHARRAHPRRRRRHPRLLHPHRRRHDRRRGQGSARVRRRDLS